MAHSIQVPSLISGNDEPNDGDVIQISRGRVTFGPSVLGIDVKQSCRLATTGNLVALSGLLVIDGVQTVAGNRVLVKNQVAAETNGIYVVAAGAWARASDADTSAKVTSGMFAFVEEGTQADQGWILSTPNPIVLDTTPLTFAQFTGTGLVVAGAGLVAVGNTLNVGANADGSMTVNPDDIQVGVLATDAQHGARGGGTQHAAATPAVAGFLSAADKTKLNIAVTGPAGATDKAIARFNGATGQVVQNSTPIVTDAGDILPPADNTGNIGGVGARWATVRAQNVITGDLHMQSLDGSADWTFVEEADRILVINNKTGTRFRLVLEPL